MEISSLAQRTAFYAAALAALAGCSGSPSSALTPAAPAGAHSRKPWMSPQARNKDLLYVSDDGNYRVYVYTYPAGELVGTLQSAYGSPGGMCVDTKGNIFVTEFNANAVLEYAHGGSSPIASLYDPGQPVACSFDRRTGNLAVTNEYGPSGGYGNIEVYASAQGSPQTYYTDPYIMPAIQYCAYDDHGNLFISGATNYRQFMLAEMPRNKTAFKYLTLNQYINTGGGLEWDGRYLALGDEASNPSVIYQLSISRKVATVVSTTTLDGTSRVRTFLIPELGSDGVQGTQVIAPSIFGPIGFYNYPGGGSPTMTISQNQPYAAVVSKATK